MNANILGEDEKDRLISIFLYKQPDCAATKHQVHKIVSWAESVRLENGMLDNVLSGDMFIHLTSDGDISFSLTPKGEQQAEKLIAQTVVGAVATRHDAKGKGK